jgi:hypothetical protein
VKLRRIASTGVTGSSTFIYVAEHDTQQERINIFPLADAREWLARHAEILKMLVKAINPGLPGFLRPEYSFSIDPVCGWIRFALENDLWQDRPKRALPPDAESATRAAQEFIARLREACRQKEYLELQIPPVLPDDRFARISPMGASPVLHFSHPWVDHWLCRFEVYLRTFQDDRGEVRVFGSEIDIRVGQRSKVTGFVSHWRPALLEGRQPVQMFHPKEEEGHSHPGEAQPPLHIIYELHGENCPQTFITPYYLSLEGHHGGMFPASSHSLLVTMGFAEKEDGGAYVVPQIFGGSGDYTFNWAYWRPEALFEEGLVSQGEQEFIELPPGVYNVMLHVKDNQTGVVQLHESMAFGRGEAPDEPEHVS